MVKYFNLVCLATLMSTACDDIDAPDCLQSAGEEKTFTLETEAFSALEVNDEFDVTLRQGSEQLVQLVIGENLISDISLEVKEGTLIIADQNGCNWVREFTFPKLIIATPDLVEIRQNGGGVIRSDGTLNFNKLHLISEGQTGDFELDVHCEELSVVNNDLSNYHISGITDRLDVFFASGDGRFEGADLIANFATIFQRGSNDIVIVAVKELNGRIISTGDLFYTKVIPEHIDVSLEGKGRLIFKE